MMIKILKLNFLENFDSELITSIQPIVIKVQFVPNLGHPRQFLPKHIPIAGHWSLDIGIIIIIITIIMITKVTSGKEGTWVGFHTGSEQGTGRKIIAIIIIVVIMITIILISIILISIILICILHHPHQHYNHYHHHQ